MEKRWRLREADEGVVSRLSDRLKIPPLLARLMVHRGLTEPEAARRFLSCRLSTDLPSPFLMADMGRAVDRLVRALDGKEMLCIWGDYDVDGTTGAAALVSFLREIGGDPIYYVPRRIEEGYGLNADALEPLRRRGVTLLISVDCGIGNFREVELARGLGIDVLIVDHHEPPPVLPEATAILNPHRADCPFPDKGLSGAGLAFYLMIALRAKLRETGRFKRKAVPDIRRYLDIITLGTVADMVPLRGTNRVLTQRGLMELGTSQRPGILALKQVAGIPQGEVGVGQVAFQLGPRINAAGRIDAGIKVVEMLTTLSHGVACRIARELDGHNRERQAIEVRVLEEALAQIEGDPMHDERASLVVGGEGWHPGVVGIVASRLVERYYRPAVVVGFHGGEGRGSARGIRGFHVVEGFRRCADLLEKFGGHEFAGGLTVRHEKFPLFAQRFEEVARSCLTPEELVPSMEVDAKIDFADIGLPMVRQIKRLQPFGVGNPEPLFMTRAVEVSERKDFNGGSRLRLRQGGRSLAAVAFGIRAGRSGEDSSRIPPRHEGLDSILNRGATIDVVYRLSESEWNGTSSLELRVMDARPCGMSGPGEPAS